MRFFDTLGDAIRNLWVRKLKTLLNLVGIVISCVLLLCTLAAATGIRYAIEGFLSTSYEALRFRIIPDYDRSIEPPEEATAIEEEMSDERKERMQSLLAQKWRRENLTRPSSFTTDQLEKILALEHVVDISPRLAYSGNVMIDSSETQPNQRATLSASSRHDLELASRIIFGEFLSENLPAGVLIHESLAFSLNARSDQDLKNLVGKDLSIEFRQAVDPFQVFLAQLQQQSPKRRKQLLKAVDQLLEGKELASIDPEAIVAAQEFIRIRKESGAATIKQKVKQKGTPITRSFRIVGVFRSRGEEEPPTFLTQYLGEGQLVTHYSQMQELAKEFGQNNFNNATVFIDDVRNLESTIEDTTTLSVAPISAMATLQRMYDALDRSKYSVFAVVAIILIVSAVGISNTMIISLVERSEEIGIMKAVGASNRHVTRMILLEGAITGAIAASIAIGVSYLIATLGSDVLLEYVRNRIRIQLEGPMFVIEPWMVAGTLCVGVFVSTLAGFFPARRAAKMDPIVAMGG